MEADVEGAGEEAWHNVPHATRQCPRSILTSGHGRLRLPSSFFRMRRIWVKNSTPSPGFLPRKARPGIHRPSPKLRAHSTRCRFRTSQQPT